VEIVKCMPKHFSWGPVSAKSAGVNRHFRRCHPSSILLGIHLASAQGHYSQNKADVSTARRTDISSNLLGKYFPTHRHTACTYKFF